MLSKTLKIKEFINMNKVCEKLFLMVAGVCLLLGLMSSPAMGQSSEPVTIRLGDKSVDGRIFKPHLARITQSSIRNGQTQLMWTATNDALLTEINGKKALRIVTEGASDIEPKRTWHGDILMFLQSLEPISYDWKISNGNSAIFKFEGTRIVGNLKNAVKNTEQKLDEDLGLMTTIGGIEDVVVGALPLKVGYSAKIPVYQLGQNGVQWKTYLVTGTKKVTISGQEVNAWVVEEQGKSKNTMWLVDQPPYMVKWEFVMPDGGIISLDQELVKMH